MKKFTLFGNPIEHSKSPQMHNFAMKHLGLDGSYTKTLLKHENELKQSFANIDAANITIPFKEKAYQICDLVKGRANDIKAVNTIVKKDDKLIGYNTDIDGFLEAIYEFGEFKTALILGAGGSAKAVAYALKDKDLLILNRSEKRLEFFKQNGFKTATSQQFQGGKFELVINTTSAGLNEEIYPIEKQKLEQIFQNAKFAFDLIYKQTPFLKLAKTYNLRQKNGEDMLVFQGAIALSLFFDKTQNVQEIANLMKKSLANSN